MPVAQLKAGSAPNTVKVYVYAWSRKNSLCGSDGWGSYADVDAGVSVHADRIDLGIFQKELYRTALNELTLRLTEEASLSKEQRVLIEKEAATFSLLLSASRNIGRLEYEAPDAATSSKSIDLPLDCLLVNRLCENVAKGTAGVRYREATLTTIETHADVAPMSGNPLPPGTVIFEKPRVTLWDRRRALRR
jgi:hypothetical protein